MLCFDGKSAKQQSFITSYLDPKTQGWFCVTVIYHLITTLFYYYFCLTNWCVSLSTETRLVNRLLLTKWFSLTVGYKLNIIHLQCLLNTSLNTSVSITTGSYKLIRLQVSNIFVTVLKVRE